MPHADFTSSDSRERHNGRPVQTTSLLGGVILMLLLSNAAVAEPITHYRMLSIADNASNGLWFTFSVDDRNQDDVASYDEIFGFSQPLCSLCFENGTPPYGPRITTLGRVPQDGLFGGSAEAFFSLISFDWTYYVTGAIHFPESAPRPRELHEGFGWSDAAGNGTPVRGRHPATFERLWDISRIDDLEPATLAAAVLPAGRSVQVGTPATAFGTLINAAGFAVTGCELAPVTSVPGTFFYQATDPATNAPVGLRNAPVTIAAGQAQTFVFGVDVDAELPPTDVEFAFGCADGSAAASLQGINTLLLSASAAPVPDVIALAATLLNDGFVDVGSDGGVFAVATANAGAESTIIVSADTNGLDVPVQISLCETEPLSGACIIPASQQDLSVTMGAGSTATFGVFVTALGSFETDPVANRVFVRFSDEAGVVRGSTSVAARQIPPM